MGRSPPKGVRPDMQPDVQAQRDRYDAWRKSLPPDVNVREAAANDPAIKHGAKDTPSTRQTMLDWLSKGYSKGYACDKAGIWPATWDNWKSKDPKLKELHDQAVERGTDLIEDEARRRAVEGVDRPVFQQGDCVGFVREYSDSLMSMILPGRRPMYARNRTEHTGADGGPIHHKIEVEFVKPK